MSTKREKQSKAPTKLTVRKTTLKDLQPKNSAEVKGGASARTGCYCLVQ